VVGVSSFRAGESSPHPKVMSVSRLQIQFESFKALALRFGFWTPRYAWIRTLAGSCCWFVCVCVASDVRLLPCEISAVCMLFRSKIGPRLFSDEIESTRRPMIMTRVVTIDRINGGKVGRTGKPAQCVCAGACDSEESPMCA